MVRPAGPAGERRRRHTARPRHHRRAGQARGEAGMRAWLPALLRLVLLALLVAFLTNPGWFEPLLKPLTENNAPVIYNQGSLLTLTLLHLRTVLLATLAATIVAVALAILVT